MLKSYWTSYLVRDKHEQVVLEEGMDLGESEHESSNPDESHEDFHYEGSKLERLAALFLLSLKEQFEITHSALNFAVFQVQQMIEFAVEDVRVTTCSCLSVVLS